MFDDSKHFFFFQTQEGLKVGVICKQKYRRDVHSVMPTDYDVSLHNALEKEFNDILKLTLGVSAIRSNAL